MIEARQLSKTFDGGKSWMVKDVTFRVEKGRMLVLLGRSGCGKTTTMKMLNRLIEPTSGDVLIDGVTSREIPATELRRRIGYVFQTYSLFPHMTVEENLEIVPRLLGWDKHRRRQRVTELLELVNMDPAEFRDRYPESLSGGETQRIGFARALAAKPSMMLLDEPFGALDIITREELRREFKQLQINLQLTAVLVTHDVMVALELADVLGVMQDGELLQFGEPRELINHPKHPFVEKLLLRSAKVWEAARS